MVTTRRQAREWAIQMLTAADLNPPPTAEQAIADFWAQLTTLEDEEGGTGGQLPRGKIKTFAEERVIGVLAHSAEIDAILRKELFTDKPADVAPEEAPAEGEELPEEDDMALLEDELGDE